MIGILPYFYLRKSDRNRAKKCLILGIVAIPVSFVVGLFAIVASILINH